MKLKRTVTLPTKTEAFSCGVTLQVGECEKARWAFIIVAAACVGSTDKYGRYVIFGAN